MRRVREEGGKPGLCDVRKRREETVSRRREWLTVSVAERLKEEDREISTLFGTLITTLTKNSLMERDQSLIGREPVCE